MKEKHIVAMDEFPLKPEKSFSQDYSGFIIFRIMGEALLNIDEKYYLPNIKLVFDENTLTIRNVANQPKILEELKENLNKIYNNRNEQYRLLFLGMDIKNNNLYTENGNEITFTFRDKRRIYGFLSLLQSHFCNQYKTVDKFWLTKRGIVVQSNRTDKEVEFIKIKSRIVNLLLFHLKVIDVTANNVIDRFTYRLYKNCRNLIVAKSGIECTIVCTNKSSPFFYDVGKRKSVFYKINSRCIQSKLPINLTQSELDLNYKRTAEKQEYITKISIQYDDYYPNKAIVKELKKQLNKYGIHVKLIRGDFKKPKEVADFKLYLFYNPLRDSVFSYYFLGMRSSLHLFGDDYHSFLESYLNYCQNPLDNSLEKERMRKILSEKFIYFSIGELNSTYLSRYRELDFMYKKQLERYKD